MALRLRGKAGVLAGAVSLAVGLLVGLEGRHPDGVYVDIAGVLTDCYGNTKNVKRGWVRTEAECKALLNGEAERIGTYIHEDVPDIPREVLAATISWAYNVGDGAYRSSTLRKRLKVSDWWGACDQLNRWVYITDPRTKQKVVSRGLQNRRTQEYAVCSSGLRAS